ncbi:hypothetical protein V5O48_004329 [Marasmius crinis-equi]|uniref:Actin-like ATPase domain-containing protein n=1 Tax=Marasmius crinis-equi TaxID=585013 RepID=A0ABR3FQB4_9AGAR
MQIFASRPLFPQIRTTPLAGSRLSSHLRSLLLLFGTYLPPTSPGPVNIPTSSRSMRVPPEILTDSVIDKILTRCCFVGEPIISASSNDTREMTPGFDDSSEFDMPPSSDATQSESDFSYAGNDSNMSSAQGSTSEFSVISNPRTPHSADSLAGGLQGLANLYTRHSTATDLKMQVAPLAGGGGLGYATLIIPGWIRERTAEILFEPGDVDEKSVAEVVLDALLKVPMDLRKTMASSILVVGGTSMLPGFIPRLHSELLHAIQPPPFIPRHAPMRPDRPPPPQYDRYASLRPLTPYFAVVNNPSPGEPHSDRAKNNAGKAPAFTPATLAWVGASLAGALKTGGVEVSREKWDETEATGEDSTMEDASGANVSQSFHADRESQRNILPDWTRIPLPPGAPSARVGA